MKICSGRIWPIEAAVAFERLSNELDMKAEEVGLRTGKDRTTIVNLIRLQEQVGVRKGARLLLFMAGFGLNWQSVILEKA